MLRAELALIVVGCLLGTGCMPPADVAPDPEALASFVAENERLMAMCSSVPDAVTDAVVAELRWDVQLYVELHDHHVEIVSWDQPVGVAVGEDWIVSMRVHVSDLITVGHDWKDTTWLVSTQDGAPTVASLDLDTHARMLGSPDLPMGTRPDEVDPGLWQDALNALYLCTIVTPTA